MTPDERSRAVASFLHHSSEELTKARQRSEDHIVAARRHRAEAGAQAFRNARVVGATVVGAARRLEAIRAAAPFAIVVEEACEVIEPTLMSVLAVQSAQKVVVTIIAAYYPFLPPLLPPSLPHLSTPF